MSDPRMQRMVLIGATGLVGMSLIGEARDFPHVRLTALARREVPLPAGARMEMILADPANWPGAIGDMRPDVLACALGTTWKKAGQDEQAFRAVDYGLVLQCAKAASHAGSRQMIVVTSIAADPHAKGLYLRTKGELEEALKKLDFQRIDFLQPSLLRGQRSEDPRTLERIAIAASPVTDLFMQGRYRRYRSIAARDLARAMLALAGEKREGRFTHEHDAIRMAPARAMAGRRLVPTVGPNPD